MDTYHYLFLLVILILLSGLFSASETALTSFRSIHLEEISEKNPKKGELLKYWLKKPNEMLTALLLGNNIVNILATSLATAFITSWLNDRGMGNSQNMSVFISTIVMTVVILIFGEITPKVIAKNNSTEISKSVIVPIYCLTKLTTPVIWILVMTVVILIFGEITPKVIAKNNSTEISKSVIVPIYCLTKLTTPVIWILTLISKFIGRIIGVDIKDEAIMITEQDILSYVNVGEAEGVIEAEEKDMIESMVTFGETCAREVMTPRTSVFAIEGNKSINDVWKDIVEQGYSRIPVYKDGMDEIIGILYIKDLLNAVKEGKCDMPVKEFMRKAYFVPETKSIIKILEDFKTQKVHMAIVIDEYGGTVGVVTIEDLIEEIFGEIRETKSIIKILEDFKTQKVHMAIVIDEYGGTVGVVTIEDLIEEIFGEIRDEYDKEEEEAIKEKGPNTYEVDAMLDIETINKELDIELPESEDYESLGGLIMNELGEIAKAGDIVKISGVELKVLEIQKMRISKVQIKKESEEKVCLIMNELGEIAKAGDIVKISGVELKVLEIQKMRISKVQIKKESEEKVCTEE